MSDYSIVRCWKCGALLPPRMGYIVEAGVHPFSKQCFYNTHTKATRYMCVVCVNEVFQLMGIKPIKESEEYDQNSTRDYNQTAG